ncbi:prephenate dehydrogenase [Bacillota bacterium LX-D]|nr:prephenate dehydrogenase [Bacillota bacterium LX-D]
MVNKAVVIGLGLIGGSLAMAMKQSCFVKQIVGIDTNENSIAEGIKLGIIDEGTKHLTAGVNGADLVILATPVGQIIPIAERISPYLPPGCVITDVGSCKSLLVSPLENIYGAQKHYIGGHPMAGSERAGIEAATPFLFENAVYVLTPTKNTNKQALHTMESLIKAIGANKINLDPHKHDYIVAAVSHLPHIIAANLVNTVGELAKEEQLTLMLAASGFKDTTRIAMGDITMWRDICLSNRKMLKKMLTLFRQQLDEFEKVIDEENKSLLADLLGRAQTLRKQIPSKAKGLLPSIYELEVIIPDRSGMLAEITNILAVNNINIIDIEILRVREALGGTVRIGFADEKELTSALEVLKQQNFQAMRR